MDEQIHNYVTLYPLAVSSFFLVVPGLVRSPGTGNKVLRLKKLTKNTMRSLAPQAIPDIPD